MTEVQEINQEGTEPTEGVAGTSSSGSIKGGNGSVDSDARGPGGPRIFSARRIILLTIFVGGFAGFFAFDLHSYVTFDTLKQNREWLLAQVAEHRIVTALAFVTAYAAVVAFSVPVAAIVSVTGGFLFGLLFGTVWNVIGATVGAILLFLAARSIFADILHEKAGPWLQKIEAGFNENAFSYLLFLRFVPVFPFFAVNLAPAFLGVRLGTFAVTTFIGIIPGAIVYSLFGAGLGAIFDRGEEFSASQAVTPEIIAGLVGLAVLSLMPIAVKMWRAKRNRS
jgi:uncharacterized membrane protein YdjX (TVP38/TMEM64 family)